MGFKYKYMTKNEDYYGSNEFDSLTYLEFGSIDIKKRYKTVFAYWQDSAAYDIYAFSRYAHDILMFRDLELCEDLGTNLEKLNECVTSATSEDCFMGYLLKYCGLITAVQLGAKYEICELGSSLFGLIDEAIVFDNVLNDGKHVAGIKDLRYLGCDVSEFMNKGAEALHEQLKIRFTKAPTIDALMRETLQLSLFYGLGISLRYSLREAKDILNICKKTEIALFNSLSLAKTGGSMLTFGTGKKVYIVSLQDLTGQLKDNGIRAKYYAPSAIEDKDGPDTLRAFVVMAKDADVLEAFVSNYGHCINKSFIVPGVQTGQWKELENLLDE